MTKTEFKIFLSKYKEFTEICKEILKKKFPEENSLISYIKDGKIKTLSDSEMNFDITNEFLEYIIPDNLIF